MDFEELEMRDLDAPDLSDNILINDLDFPNLSKELLIDDEDQCDGVDGVGSLFRVYSAFSSC
jgi:hypothetical protein